MTHSSRVVMVGVDGSEASLHALDWAVREAGKMAASLHLVCSYSLPSFAAMSLDGGYAGLDAGAIEEGARKVLAEAAERVADSGLTVTSSLEVGDPAGVLVDMSKEVCLAVVGTRGRGGFAERLLGTVSASLPAHGHCPVVVVPLRTGASGVTTSLAGPVRRIVVGVDGSPASKVSLNRAIEEALTWGAELTAFTSVPVSTGASLFAWAPGIIDHDAILTEAQASLDGVVARALEGRELPPGFDVKCHALDGSAASLLVEFSTAVDLVVVGSRGRGGFSGLLLGSTSQAVLHHAVCPIMVIPAKVKEEGLPPAAVAEPR